MPTYDLLVIGDEAGFLKLLFRHSDLRLLDVHVGGGTEIFSSASFNYPTLGDLYKTTTYDAIMQRFRAASSESSSR